MGGATATDLTGQPDGPQYYAVEQLREAQKRLLDLSQSLVLWRARVEKYRTTDLAAAKDTFDVLLSVRHGLAETLGESRLLLMEAEEYQTAVTAGKLRDGLLGFNLMSGNYGPVYNTLRAFAQSLPVEGTTNAAIVGRLMNNIKLGYYPTDPDNIALMLHGIQFPEGITTNLLDPCCGCGKALRQIAQGNNCYAYGVELDESRAEEAQTRLHRVGFGSFFYSRISREAFHLMFLNPPYLSVLNESGGKSRHEKRFLIESFPALAYGGLLIYVIPYYAFAQSLPVEGATNAAIVGRLMNNIKLGYYPTDPDNIALMLRGIQFPEGVTTNLLDPCCGCGKALRQIAQGNNCYAYGMELDESRAEEAQTRLHRVGFGSFFYSQISREAFHLLFLNPPYLSVLNESGGKSRHEKRFLIESFPALAYGGLLIYVIPYYRLTPDICRVLVDNFSDLTVWRFTDAEFKKFKQVAVFGVRKRRGQDLQDTLWLERYAENPATIPSLTELPEDRYTLPGEPLEVPLFQGQKFNRRELEQQLRRSASFTQMMTARSELDDGTKRPLLPLSISQIGLVGGSGMINGLIECDSPHIIKGRIIKVIRTVSEELHDHDGMRMGEEIRETISNKMIFNILTPKGFKALT